MHSEKPPVTPNHPLIAEGWRCLAVFFDKFKKSEALKAATESQYNLLGNPLGIALEPYASHYIEGSRQGVPLIETRRFLKKWDLVPEKDNFKDFEDHAVFMLDCLVQIANLTETEGVKWEEAMEECLEKLVLPWMANFFHDLELKDNQEEKGGFYAGLAKIGQGILALEEQVIQEP